MVYLPSKQYNKNLFPIRIARSRSFRRYTKIECVSRLCGVSQLVGHLCMLRPTDRYTSYFLKEKPERPYEPFLFIMKLILRPSALMYSCPITKSQLLVWGARQIIYLSGWDTVTSFFQPPFYTKATCKVFAAWRE